MLNPSLGNCVSCTTIPALLSDIDCKMTELAKNLYNNTIFILNRDIPRDAIWDLLIYKRVLTYKYCNPEYCSPYSVEKIASKIKLLIHK